LPNFYDFRQISAIFAQFLRFSPNFCDFRQFSAKKLAFVSTSNFMSKCFQNLAVVWAINGNVLPIFLTKMLLKT
jgi:hypothetical protein